MSGARSAKHLEKRATKLKERIWVLAFASAATAGSVLAHGGATGIVKERMEMMKTMRADVKTMGQMARGQRPYDAALFAQAAEDIAAHSGDFLVALFPKGSLHAPTEAAPAIWDDMPRFSRLADELETQAVSLAAAAVASQELPMAEFKALGQACAACHEDYRIKQD